MLLFWGEIRETLIGFSFGMIAALTSKTFCRNTFTTKREQIDIACVDVCWIEQSVVYHQNAFFIIIMNLPWPSTPSKTVFSATFLWWKIQSSFMLTADGRRYDMLNLFIPPPPLLFHIILSYFHPSSNYVVNVNWIELCGWNSMRSPLSATTARFSRYSTATLPQARSPVTESLHSTYQSKLLTLSVPPVSLCASLPWASTSKASYVTW